MNTIAKFTSAVLCGLVLTACGGDNNPDCCKPPVGFSYETQQLSPDSADSAGLLALLNEEGAKGYFYWYGDQTSLTFVNDSSGKTYTYALLDSSGNASDFLAQANAQGKNGYRYEEHSNIPWNVYRKDSGPSATYTYVAQNLPADAKSFVTQANAQGIRGYLFVPTHYSTLQPPQQAIYMSDSTNRAVYDYEVLDLNITQLNTEGAKGYRALLTGEMEYAWLASAAVYVKDQRQQAATFAYESVPRTNVSLNQMNNYGAKGYAYWGSASSPSNLAFYVKADRCSGWICTALHPAGSVSLK